MSYSLDKWTIRQPDGGRLEGCTVIVLNSFHSTNNWQDVPCASGEANQYVCRMVPTGGTQYFLFHKLCDCIIANSGLYHVSKTLLEKNNQIKMHQYHNYAWRESLNLLFTISSYVHVHVC